MNQNDLNQHFDEEHSNELCSVEDEIQFVVESQPPKASAKRQRNEPKTIEYQEIDGEQYEIVNEEDQATDIAASFDEYEELELEPEAKIAKVETPAKKLQHALNEAKSAKKSYPAVKKSPPSKPLPTRLQKSLADKPKAAIERVKMSKEKIAQLTKEGKIKMVNGQMVMKT